MKPSEACLALTRRSERFIPRPYLCPALVWTIGYGSTRDAVGKPVTAATPAIDEPTARVWMRRDVDDSAAAVLRLITVPLTQGQFDALVDFTYNLGGGNLQASTLRRLINRGAYNEAPAQLRRWVNGGGRVLPGLVWRREEEIKLWNSRM